MQFGLTTGDRRHEMVDHGLLLVFLTQQIKRQT
jgi:hypothetical protein